MEYFECHDCDEIFAAKTARSCPECGSNNITRSDKEAFLEWTEEEGA